MLDIRERLSTGVGGETSPPTRRRLSMRAREHIAGYLFTAPQIVGFLAVVVWPVVAVFWYSAHDFQALTGQSEFVGADNYAELARDPRLPSVLRATAFFVVGLVPLGVTLALLLAVLINQRLPGIKIFRAVYFAPTLVSLAAWTIVWQFMLLDDGAINALLRLLGVDGPNWLREPGPAMAAVVLVQLFKGVGLNMLIFLAALQAVPRSLMEAARVDGAGPWTTFRKVTLPMISAEILMVIILMVIGSFKVFAQILLLTGGGPGYNTTVLAFYIYRQAFGSGEFGYAGALSVLLFAVMLLVVGALWQLRTRVVFHESR